MTVQSRRAITVLYWLVLGIALSTGQVNAQTTFPPPSPPAQFEASRAKGRISVDGKLDEPDWLAAKVIGAFVQVNPDQGKPLKYETEVKILFDDTYLYIGAYCQDSIGHKRVLRVQDLSRDFNFDQTELFAIRIDPFHQKRNALAFDTNPYGVQRDAQIFDDRLYEINWNALWNVKTSITAKGWYAEFAIPFSSIRYPKANGDGSRRTVWGIKFQRIQRRVNELSALPAFPRSIDGTQMSYEGDLINLEVPTPHSNVQVLPYGLFTTRLLSAGTSLYYNPRIIVNGLLLYNSLESSLNYNFKFSWEYHPLSFIYLVLTDIKDRYNRFSERQFINKISFVKQF